MRHAFQQFNNPTIPMSAPLLSTTIIGLGLRVNRQAKNRNKIVNKVGYEPIGDRLGTGLASP